MKAALLDREEHFSIVEIEAPEPGPDEVIIEVKRAGLCGSEIEGFFGRHPFRKAPVVTGHEMSGVISALGSRVSGVAIGDKVTLEPQIPCGTCRFCRGGRSNLCRSRISLGTRKWPGPFGQYIRCPADKLLPLPDGMSFDEAVLVEPLAVGVHAVRRVSPQNGECLVIVGSGTIGVCALAAAKALSDVDRVIVTDISGKKLEMAAAMGADHIVNVSDPEQREAIRDLLPEGADAAIVAAGAPEGYDFSTEIAARDGRIGVVGLCKFPALTPIKIGGPGPELEIKGCTAYVNQDFQDALEILPRSGLKKLISEIRPIEDIQLATENFIANTDKLFKVLFSFESSDISLE